MAPEEGYVSATNHYVLPEMRPYDVSRRQESVARQRTIGAGLGDAAPKVDHEILRALLSRTMPHGLCQHYYSGGLGTLWCSITDVTEGMIEVCFGAPSSKRNPWHAFGLRDTMAPQTYAAHLPDEPAPVGFWQRLPAGCEE